MRWVLLAVMLPGIAVAQEWRVLTAEEISVALSARVLTYAGDHRQDFMADGRTLFDDNWGSWRVEGDQYCSQWPPSDRWTCYWVSVNGLDVRFVDQTGLVTEGRYGDLR